MDWITDEIAIGNLRDAQDSELLKRECIWSMLSLISRLVGRSAASLGVELPKQAPAQYAALTWAQIKEVAANGIEIGSHTLTHPILLRVDRDRLHCSRTRCQTRIPMHTPIASIAPSTGAAWRPRTKCWWNSAVAA